MKHRPRRTSSIGGSNTQLVPWIALGFSGGLLLGYLFLGTIEAVVSSRLHTGDNTIAQQAAENTVVEVEKREEVQKLSAQQSSHAQAVRSSGSQFPDKGTEIHTLCTSNGSPYLNFQTRIMHGTYKQVQALPGGERLVGFTRILHRTKPDVLVDEVPTWRADPLTPQCDEWCEFPVSDRPNAVAQWMAAAENHPDMIKAPWLLMIETDYVWLKPPLAPPAEDTRAPSWAFPFGYIVPTDPGITGVMRKMFPEDRGPISRVPGSGPAPVMLRVHEWAKVIPDWERLTAHIEADKESKEKLGWVREMYAFSVAVALQNVKLELLLPPKSPLISQPPSDTVPGAASMLHYTWGTMFLESNDSKTWEFDKRTFTDKSIETETPNIPMPPPFQPRWHLHNKLPVTPELHKTLVMMLTHMNDAIDLLPKPSSRVS
ncbi:hypothetical protein WJX73_002433 [Symbiochloris irregularis]|uniref:Hydroxyproline O-arabinosyltransferase-like domain-containing protein n=1 Tax=Symbiochloris irregularis TaxID=706552 RepID=A0AAW1NVB1_9CHLO